jgi:hypothetical protein
MNTRGFTAILVGLCLGTSASGGETVTSDGTMTSHSVTYRIVGVNSSYMVTPLRDPTTRLSDEESLARCDELVAAVLARVTAGERVEFVRDRIYSPPGGQGWVDYSQRHQGYRIVSAGARVNRDPSGRIFLMGLQYESRHLPTFVARDTTALVKVASRAVPHRITGPPLQAEVMVGGDAPSGLTCFVIFPIRYQGMDSGWQVDVDAVTGEVFHSASTARHASGNRGAQ